MLRILVVGVLALTCSAKIRKGKGKIKDKKAGGGPGLDKRVDCCDAEALSDACKNTFKSWSYEYSKKQETYSHMKDLPAQEEARQNFLCARLAQKMKKIQAWKGDDEREERGVKG